jgi:hypothetical protein
MIGDDSNSCMTIHRIDGCELSNMQDEASGTNTFVLCTQAVFGNYSVLGENVTWLYPRDSLFLSFFCLFYHGLIF